MKRLIKAVLKKMGWRLIEYREDSRPAFGANAYFALLKRLGFAPKNIVDIGANHGKWTRTVLEYFPDANYTLIEPQDHLKADIQDLIAKGHKLNWINAGVGDQPGTLMFTVAERDDSSSFVPSAQASNRPQIPIPIRTLNEIVASSGRPAPELVKIDAEGFDLKVLTGASELFGKTEVFLIEALVCASGYENSMLEVLRRMDAAGYKPMDITDLNRSPKHGVLWLCELAFVRKDSPLLKGVTAYV
jgi:FkbM family methyltransferase